MMYCKDCKRCFEDKDVIAYSEEDWNYECCPICDSENIIKAPEGEV